MAGKEITGRQRAAIISRGFIFTAGVIAVITGTRQHAIPLLAAGSLLILAALIGAVIGLRRR